MSENNDIEVPLIEMCEDLMHATRSGEIKGVLALLEHSNGEISVARAGSALNKSVVFQPALTRLNYENAIYPDEPYLLKKRTP